MITPDSFAYPKFWDKAIQDINTDLTALGWISNVFPLSQIGIDEEGTFPEVYKNDGTRISIRVFPDGNSVSFFTLESAAQIDETDYYKVDLGLIVWADLTKVYPNKDYNYTTELLNDVRGVLDSHGGYEYNIELQGVFAEYDQLDKVLNQNTMLPYTAFKFNFSVSLKMC